MMHTSLIYFSIYCLLSLKSLAESNYGEWIDTEWINYPYMALIDRSCGGSIISLDGSSSGNGVILTAGHCLNLFTKNIEIGCTKSNCGNNEGTVYGVESVVIHPEYDESLPPNHINSGNNDIGLIFLNSPIYHIGAKKIDLENNINNIKNNDELLGLGYLGVCDHEGCLGGSDIDTLEYEITHFMTSTECSETWGNQVLGEHEFCVKDDIPDIYNKLTSSCAGDSGSPLINLFNNKQIGLVSAGDSFCNPNIPSIVTSIPYYYNWIKSQCPNCIDSIANGPTIRPTSSPTRSNTQPTISTTQYLPPCYNNTLPILNERSIQSQDCAYHAGTTLNWCWKACKNYIIDSSHWCWTGTRCGADANVCTRYPMECYYPSEERYC